MYNQLVNLESVTKSDQFIFSSITTHTLFSSIIEQHLTKAHETLFAEGYQNISSATLFMSFYVHIQPLVKNNITKLMNLAFCTIFKQQISNFGNRIIKFSK